MSTNTTRGSGTHGSKKPHSPSQHAPRSAKPRASTLRQRQEAQRALAEARREREGRKRRLWVVLAPIAVIVLVVATLVAVRLGSGAGGANGKAGGGAAPAVVAKVTGVPASVFDAVGVSNPYQLPTRINAAPLTADGKPRILYVGAEYCPFCAVERWPMIVALSRFGTWHGLSYTYSGAAPEPYPNTATFSFHGASYTSDYLSFTGIETHTNQRQGNGWEPLDTLGGADLAVFQKDDTQGATPFVDFGGRWIIVGATYQAGLVAGHTHAEIAATLADPSNKTGAGIIEAANVMTAALCQLTGNQPASVCTSPGVTAGAKVLP